MKYLQTYRLHPTPSQADKLRQRFALAGYAYNWGLRETERVFQEEGRHLSLYDIKDRYHDHVHYTLHRPCSREEDEALVHLDFAYSQNFQHRAEKPREKQPEDMTSCTDRAEKVEVEYHRNTVRIPKVGRVRCRLYRPVQDHPTTATVKEVRPGEFRIIFLTDVADRPVSDPQADVVGIDLGIKTFATLSDGTAIEFPEHIWGRRPTRHEAHLQRRLSRCKEGSKRWHRAKERLARFHEHRANQRKDFHYKTAARLTTDYKAIAVEHLAVEEMKQQERPWRRSLNRNFQNYGLTQFLRRLEARCQRTGTQFLQIDRFAPTSKTCHQCGYRRRSLSLKVREWTCPRCHTHHDRDLNAAINIQTLGRQLQQQRQTLPDVGGEVLTVEQTRRACRETVKADVAPQRPTRPAPSPQEDKEHNITRLAVRKGCQRELNASDFLKLLQPVVRPQVISQITELPATQLKGVRRVGWTVDWRRQLIHERCEHLRLQLIDILQSKIPPLMQTTPADYAEWFTKEMRPWLYRQQVCRDEKGLSWPVTAGNALLWHLYATRLVRNLELITLTL